MILIFPFLVFSSLYSMEHTSVEQPAIVIEITEHTSIEIDLLRYYHHDTKELNLSNIQIGDANLAVIESQLKTFIESVGVERLIIENADLKTVPFNLIGFTLISKTLKYVSFLGNKFATTCMLDVSSGAGGEDVRPPSRHACQFASSQHR